MSLQKTSLAVTDVVEGLGYPSQGGQKSELLLSSRLQTILQSSMLQCLKQNSRDFYNSFPMSHDD